MVRLCEPITRQSCDMVFGDTPLDGPPESVYDVCLEVDLRVMYKFSSDTGIPDGEDCDSYSEIQQRERAPGGAWGMWSGDGLGYEYEQCGAGLTQQTRVRFQAAQSECIQSGTELPEECGGDSMCAQSTDCVPEVQSRVQLEGSAEWGDWTGTYTFKECVQTETIKRFDVTAVTGRNCISEIRSRTRMNNGEWTIWSGGFEVISCTQTEERIMWQTRDGGPGECVSQVQTRERTDGGEWGPWTDPAGSIDAGLMYGSASCVQRETR